VLWVVLLLALLERVGGVACAPVEGGALWEEGGHVLREGDGSSFTDG
jgi:hypothetical protein